MYTRASKTDILARKSARVGQKSADKSARIVVRVRLARGKLNGPRAPRKADCRARRGTPRRLPREDPRTEVGEEVRVGVRVGPVEFKL